MYDLPSGSNFDSAHNVNQVGDLLKIQSGRELSVTKILLKLDSVPKPNSP